MLFAIVIADTLFFFGGRGGGGGGGVNVKKSVFLSGVQYVDKLLKGTWMRQRNLWCLSRQ